MREPFRIPQLMAACDYAALGGTLVLLYGQIREARFNMREVAEMLHMAKYPFNYLDSHAMIEIGDGHLVFRGAESYPQNTLSGTGRLVELARVDSLRDIRGHYLQQWRQMAEYQSRRYSDWKQVWDVIYLAHLEGMKNE